MRIPSWLPMVAEATVGNRSTCPSFTAPFVEQARAKAKAKAQDHESDLSDLSDIQNFVFKGLEGTGAVRLETSRQDSRVGNEENREEEDGRIGDQEVEVETPASPALQLQPKRARQAPARYQD